VREVTSHARAASLARSRSASPQAHARVASPRARAPAAAACDNDVVVMVCDFFAKARHFFSLRVTVPLVVLVFWMMIFSDSSAAGPRCSENRDCALVNSWVPHLQSNHTHSAHNWGFKTAMVDRDVNARAGFGYTLLHIASQEGNATVAAALIRMGADINAKSESGWTPLMWAAFNGHTETATALLAAHGIRANEKDKWGATALMWAAREGRFDIVNALLAILSIEDVNAKTKMGESALWWAQQRNHTEVAHAISSICCIHPEREANSTSDVGSRNVALEQLAYFTDKRNLDTTEVYKITALIHEFSGDTEVCAVAVDALNAVLTRPSRKEEAVNEDAPSTIVTVIRIHAIGGVRNDTVARLGSRALATIAEIPRGRRPSVDAGAPGALVEAMRVHQTVANVSLWGCAAIANFADDFDAGKRAAVDAGAPAAIVKAMTIHAGFVEVADACSWALYKIAQNFALGYAQVKAVKGRDAVEKSVSKRDRSLILRALAP
jgi:hypothetical protein